MKLYEYIGDSFKDRRGELYDISDNGAARPIHPCTHGIPWKVSPEYKTRNFREVNGFIPYDRSTWPEEGQEVETWYWDGSSIKKDQGVWCPRGTYVSPVAWRPVEQESQKIQASVEVLAEPREMKTLYADTLDDLLEEIRSFVDGRKTGEIIIT